MSIVSLDDCLIFLGIDTDETDNSISGTIDSFRLEAEEFISSYCRRSFDETSYRLERYDGNSGTTLNLNNYPITAVDRVAIGTLNVMQVRNTNQYSTTTVSATTTGMRLVLNGTANTTVTFAANTTMIAVVNAINALGSGWEARITSNIYSNFKSTEIIPCYGLNSIDSNWVDLYKTDVPLSDFHVYLDRGQIKRYNGFPSGGQNIYIDYTAGFTSSNMPSDLQLAVKIIVQYLYNKNQESSFGLTQYRIGYNSVLSIFEEGSIPKEAERILFKYRRNRV